MTHRYNTRFQAKQIQEKQNQAKQTQAKQMPLFLSSHDFEKLRECTFLCSMNKCPNSCQSARNTSVDNKTEEQTEIENLQAMLKDVSKETTQIKKILLAIRIYHFLEHKHTFLQGYSRFRNVVRAKAHEFIAISKERANMLDHIDKKSNVYTSESYILIVMLELKRSCENVLKFLDTIESRPFS